ncbi:hypothetical protein F2P56_019591 [Juglans regia]|uniref:Uncharacterized protein LOC109015593 n=2 Tax=Juglans regia TaxID=51240 RepID=A0A2I4F742_JUGRE|nr:uncharacterized protein LOC109015593 [Juglans regia]KAF5459663.1 hypothetical protein F2P56_019591 [Juglans regia]
MAKVRALFNPNMVEAILRLHPSHTGAADHWLWEHEKSGSFSIKSAYSFFKTILESEHGESSNGAVMKKFWTALWKLQVPHKVKVFAWRACKDCLPTKANLIKRKLDIEGKCCFCQHPLEDLRHVLILCPSTYGFLRSRFAVLQISSFLTTAMDILFKGNFKDLSDFFLMVWAFWFRRNKMVHEQIALPPQQVIGFAFTKKLHSVVVRQQLGNHISKNMVYIWSPPPEDSLKLNIDGALFLFKQSWYGHGFEEPYG